MKSGLLTPLAMEPNRQPPESAVAARQPEPARTEPLPTLPEEQPEPARTEPLPTLPDEQPEPAVEEQLAPEPVDVGSPEQNATVDLARIAWIVTVLACVVTIAILVLEGYYGYALVTFAVAVSAGINLT
jgi:hypothetical protein